MVQVLPTRPLPITATLLRAAGTVRPPDYATRYLGYSTDNGELPAPKMHSFDGARPFIKLHTGAYYYYNPSKDYGSTLRAVHAYAQRERIPYRYALLDSWWYEKGSGDGVRNWPCTAQACPQGCQGLSEELGWRFMLHNREWRPVWKFEQESRRWRGGMRRKNFDSYAGGAPTTSTEAPMTSPSSRRWRCPSSSGSGTTSCATPPTGV